MEHPSDAVAAAKEKAAMLALDAKEAAKAATEAQNAARAAITAAADAKDEAEAIAEGRPIGPSSAPAAISTCAYNLGKQLQDHNEEVELIIMPPLPAFDENIVNEEEEVSSN